MTGVQTCALPISMVQGPGMRDLIGIGMVCEYRVIASQTEIDEALLRIGSTGDFTPASIKAARKSEIIGDVVETYQRQVPGRQAIVFAVDVQDARDIADRFVAGASVPHHWTPPAMTACASRNSISLPQASCKSLPTSIFSPRGSMCRLVML